MISETDFPDIWSHICALDKAGIPLLVYGMGNGGDKLLDRLVSLGITPKGVYASDGFVRGQTFRGYTVQSRTDLYNLFPNAVSLVAFASHRPEVLETVYSLSEQIPLYVPDLPVAGGEYFDAAFADTHRKKIQSAGKLFADQLSAEIYTDIIAYKLSGELSWLRKTGRGEYPLDSVLHPSTYVRTLDAGAYTGDTVRKLIPFSPNLSETICIEPDPATFKRLLKYVSTEERVKIVPLHAALSDSIGKAFFASSGNRNSTLHDGSFESKRTEVEVTTVDEVIGNTDVDFIKYDVEGEEEKALLGSQKTIARCRPELLVSVYHRSRDIFALPLLLSELCPNYHFYLRRNECFPAWEIDLLAVPCEKDGINQSSKGTNGQ